MAPSTFLKKKSLIKYILEFGQNIIICKCHVINLETTRGFIKSCSSLENAGKGALPALKRTIPRQLNKSLAPSLRIFKRQKEPREETRKEQAGRAWGCEVHRTDWSSSVLRPTGTQGTVSARNNMTRRIISRSCGS